MALPVLTYFPIGGRARAIRLAFALGKVAFEDKHISFADFGAKKAAGEFPLGSIPVLDVAGERFAQSNAILRYAGKLTGLYPEDPIAAMRVDMFLDTIEELSGKISATMRLSAEAKLEARAVIAKDEFPRYLGGLNKCVAASPTGLIAGVTTTGTLSGGISIADLALFNVLSWVASGILDGIPAATLDAFPALLAVQARVAALPEVAAIEEASKPKA